MFGGSRAGQPSGHENRPRPVRAARDRRRDGGRRAYLATDTPIALTGGDFKKYPDTEPLTFVELRVNANGEGMGKLSEASRLAVDETRNVIELREFEMRPLHLVMVRDELGE